MIPTVIKGATVVVLVFFVAGCAVIHGSDYKHSADTWASHLRIGMTKPQVEETVGRKPNEVRTFRENDYEYFRIPIYGHPQPGCVQNSSSRDSLFDWLTDVAPHDLPRRVREGTEVWLYHYWLPPDVTVSLNVYFSESGTVLGWSKPRSAWNEQKYRHERLTAWLHRGWGGLFEINQENVRRRLGPPEKIVEIPVRRPCLALIAGDRAPDASAKYLWEIYEDHYWSSNQIARHTTYPLWVYTYRLTDGSQRHVYIFFDNYKKVLGWGYDQAHQEAARYVRKEKGEN